MAGTKRLVYLDACILIAMVTAQHRKGNEAFDAAGLAQQIERRDIIAVTSTLSRVEVLDCTLDLQQRNILKKLLAPPKIQIKSPDIAIMDIAHDIRDFYKVLKDNGASTLPTVETPDAIHLATAIFYDCDVFYTFDENDKTSPSRPKRGLIPMSGQVADKYYLTIKKPDPDQSGLPV